MATTLTADFANQIREKTGENVFECYQCIKCTSGCPLAEHFDLAPNQVMRAAQLGMEDMIYASKTAWLCASCQTCTTRCPQGIDIAKVMDFIVGQAIEGGIEPQVPQAALFNKVFLRNVDVLGRAYELGLIVEMNVRTGQPLKDLGLGVEMFRRGKIKLLPKVVIRRKRQAKQTPPQRSENEVGYYPGCSLHGMAKEFDRSARFTLEKLGITPVEPKDWICCGATPAHRLDHHLATRLPLQSLALFEQEGLKQLALPCASCFSRFRTAVHDLRNEPKLKEELEAELGYSYDDRIEICSLLDLITEKIGLEAVRLKVQRPLEGLRVACYYGCLLTRPPEITGAQDPEYPMAMDRLMEALGATPVPWDSKVACCGAALSLIETDLVLQLSGGILGNAQARGADVVAVACPLCHANLDGRQSQIDPEIPIPALYFTQLIALAFGDVQSAALGRNMIDPHPVLADRGLI
jgi:heterodisulfide reductase subunit B